MLGRILAGVAAIALVVGAFALRGGSDDGGGSATITGGDRSGVVICAAEFAAACDDLDGEVRIEQAGTTADRLLDGGELGADAWVTTSVWVDVVEGERDRLGQPGALEVQATVAQSPVVLAAWADRADQLRNSCESVDWACLAERSGTTLAAGDTVKVVMPPVDSATGLVVAAAQARSLTGRPDFAANDFGSIRGLVADLAANQIDDPLATMRSRGPGRATAAGLVAADASATSSNFGTIEVTEDDVVARVVVAQPIQGGGIADLDPLVDALVAAGWVASDGAETGAELPGGSVLAAVRSIWAS